MALSFNLQQEPNVQIPQEQQFQPKYDAHATKQIIKTYKQNPARFTEESLNSIRSHAQYHNVPFYEGEFSLIDAVAEVGKGFISGFTTLDMFDHPDNEWEAIARNVGHLAGFAPGIMGGPLKAMGAKGLAAQAQALNKASIPMWTADKATKFAKKLAKPILNTASSSQYKALNTASEFILGNQAKHIMEGAFHLGAASAVSSWQQGIDTMMQSFIHGGVAGGVFRGLGNLVNTGDKAADKGIRAIAGSLFQGLPATMRGATTPEQIYDYLLGAYFGSKEMPWYKAKAAETHKKYMEQEADPSNPKANMMKSLKDPTLMEGYEKLPNEVKTELGSIFEKTYKNLDQRRAIQYGLLEYFGIEDKVSPKSFDKLNEILSPKKEAVKEGESQVFKEEKIGDKTVRRFMDIEAEKIDIQGRIDIINKSLETATEADKVILQRELKTLSSELTQAEKIQSKIEALKPEEVLDFDSERTFARVDLQAGLADNTNLEPKAYYFARQHAKLIDNISTKEAEVQAASSIQKRVNDFVKEIKKNPDMLKDGLDTIELSNRIQEDIKGTIKEEGHKDLRRWVTEKIYSNPVRFISATGGHHSKLSTSIKRTDRAPGGTRKLDRSPITALEQAFINSGGKGKGEPGILILDTISDLNKKNGKMTDYSLSNYRRFLLKENSYREIDAKALYEITIQHIVKDMNKKDYYAFAGTADKDRIIFAKYHPGIKKGAKTADGKPTKPQNLLRKLPNIQKYYNKSLSEFKKKYRLGKQEHDKQMLSNLLYDLDMNGFSHTVENVKKLTKEYTKKQKEDNVNKKNIAYDPFIKNGVAFNKRMQIWMTNGYSADGQFIGKHLGKKGDLNADGTMNYILERTMKGKVPEKLWHDLKNTETEYHNDGPIHVRDDLVEAFNADSGNPVSGQNKAFIVSPHSKHGALLGKFAFHAVGPKMSAEMKRLGLHMIIPESSAKQSGTREFSDYTYSKNDNMRLKEHTIHTLDPSHIKYSYSSRQGKHMLDPQRIFKQMWMFQSQTAQVPFSKEVMNDMFDTVVSNKFRGEEAWNTKLEGYLEEPTAKGLKELERNIDKIGVRELLDAAHNNNGTEFADTIYSHMLKKNRQVLREMRAEEELSDAETEDALERLDDFDSGTQRIMKEAQKWAQRQRAEGNQVSALPVYLHKYVRDFRMAMMQNFIVFNVTRPTIKNSASGVLRPYTKELQNRFPELNKKGKKSDEVFYLDDMINPELETHIPGFEKTTLKELWDAYNKGGKTWPHKSDAEEVFRAANVRIPMSSASGTRILRFGGFTGIKGHGILMRDRAMEGLGGADLDIDKAVVFFGGRKGEKGSGWKKEWKDEYHNQKEEFTKTDKDGRDYTPDKKSGTIERPDGKYKDKTFRWLLTQGKASESESSKVFQYSPFYRNEISQRAVEGRNMLGGAVQLPQVLKAAHDLALNKKTLDGKPDRTFLFYDKKTKQVFSSTPRTDKKWLEYARRLEDAEVAFGSDPLDEIGLKSYDVFFNELYDAYFKVQIKKGNKFVDINDKRLQKTKDYQKLRDSIYSKFRAKHSESPYAVAKNVSNAFFSRNYTDNRRYNMNEIMDLSRELDVLEGQEFNHPLLKMGSLLRGPRENVIDWSDSVYRRVNTTRIEDAYKEVDRFVKSIPKEWKGAFNRGTFRVPYNKYVRRAAGSKLHIKLVRDKLSGELNKNEAEMEANNNRFESLIKDTVFEKEWNNYKRTGVDSYGRRQENATIIKRKILEDFQKMSEDFLINDVNDMASIMLIKEAMNKGISLEKASMIYEDASKIKDFDFFRLVNKATSRTREGSNLPKEEAAKMLEEIFKGSGVKVDAAKLSRAKEQWEVDNIITKYRKGLTKPEKELFDAMLMGSYKRSQSNKMIKQWEQLVNKRKNGRAADFTSILRDASRTATTRIGFDSKAIPAVSIQKFLGKFSDMMAKTWEKPSQMRFEEFDKAVDKSERIVKGDGKIEKGNIFKQEVDKAIKDSLVEDLSGYEGISKGTLSKEEARLVAELGDNLSRFNGKAKENLNEVLKGILTELELDAKDLNAMNLQDFQIINNYLKEMRGGTVWQKLFGDKTPDMKARYHMQFPKTVAREFMKYDIQWLKSKGMFLTKDGQWKTGTVRRPTTWIEVMQRWIQRMGDNATNISETKINELQSELLFLEGLGSTGESLRKIAVTRREYVNRDILTRGSENPTKSKLEIEKRWAEVSDKYEGLKDKKFWVTNPDGTRANLFGNEIVNRVNNVYTKFNEAAHNLMVGDPGALEPFILKRNGKKQFYDREGLEPILDSKKFIKYIGKLYSEGKDIPLTFGVDGLRHMQRAIMLNTRTQEGQELDANTRKIIENWKITKTGKLDFEAYWPHMFHSKKKVKQALNAGMKALLKDRSLDEADRVREYKKLQMRYKSLTGDYYDTAGEDFMEFDKLVENVHSGQTPKAENVKWFDANRRMSNMHSRKVYIPGWSYDAVVPETYIRNLVQNYHQHLSQIMARETINNFVDWSKQKGWDKIKKPNETFSLMGQWINFMKLYVQDAMGHPSIIPERIFNDPGMKIKGTPYGWWADNKVRNRVNKIAKELGLSKDIKGLPENMQGISYDQLKHWSNLEAKFELASLLAHPKSMVGNIFGGSLHTIQSAGASYLKKARDIKYIKRIIPEINSKEDLTDWVIKRGVLPEFIAHEWGMAPELRKAKYKSFIKDATAKLTKTGEVDQATLSELASKHQVSQAIMQKAAAFMSIPEKALRRDSFMAHYIKAWERFGGAIKDPTHPFLIEQAKSGVKATQFLYSAPFRPAFARTALGKVMTRFQLWSWNAVRFRNDILREARIKGLKEGTEIHKKFIRTAQIDLMVFALANMFQYSLFETALPAPWNWLQDTADWLFGNERERDRAFFGTWPSNVAPLQMITPPIMRLPAAGLSAYIEDDYTKLSNYYIYTMFPFGRMIRDVSPYANGNLIDNPIRVMEKMAGIPLIQLQRMATNKNKDD